MKKVARAALGKHWYNNGIQEGYFLECPNGWIKGRLPATDHKRQACSKSLKNKICYTDGIHRLYLYRNEIPPTGFIKGCPSPSCETKAKMSLVKKGTKRSKEFCIKHAKLWASKEMQDKMNATKRKNHTFNTSKSEQVFQEFCIKNLGEDAFNIQYKEVRYNFNCDFYIPKFDLFIELNHHWTHGSKPYSKEDSFCKKQLATWYKKSKKSNFYKNAIEIWTKRDPLKLKIAKENNLNYLISYNKEDMYKIMEYIKQLIKESN